ncbi:hypothetical protein AMTR_s05676p00005180 [Amborella trichopoda]|uniref:Uncharacterized protein n=1 Tax=Amborella trichopoda TaxID=13333 RepID=U5CTX0_AMBTC|nr:hypothetical protein AMTR_s05676p00005180 [Amborella trichopoda]
MSRAAFHSLESVSLLLYGGVGLAFHSQWKRVYYIRNSNPTIMEWIGLDTRHSDDLPGFTKDSNTGGRSLNQEEILSKPLNRLVHYQRKVSLAPLSTIPISGLGNGNKERPYYSLMNCCTQPTLGDPDRSTETKLDPTINGTKVCFLIDSSPYPRFAYHNLAIITG